MEFSKVGFSPCIYPNARVVGLVVGAGLLYSKTQRLIDLRLSTKQCLGAWCNTRDKVLPGIGRGKGISEAFVAQDFTLLTRSSSTLISSARPDTHTNGVPKEEIQTEIFGEFWSFCFTSCIQIK